MTIIAIIAFAAGVVATLAAVSILIPFRREVLRPGVLPLTGALGVLAGAAAVTAILAQQGSTPEDYISPASGGIESAAAGPSSESDWSSIQRAFSASGSGATPPDDAIHSGLRAGGATARAQSSAAELTAVTQREPGNVQAWLALAQAHRTARDFPAAVSAYEAALKLDTGNADAWADYADALASSRDRRLAGPPAAAIAKALALDPRHLKALWLAASLDLELHKYQQAMERWQKLRAQLPEGSPDIAVIEANIAEARDLAARGTGG